MKSNSRKLKQEFKKLPAYSPADSVWENIEARLDQEQWNTSKQKLRIYEPSETVWENINAQLSEEAIIVPISDKKVFPTWGWTVAASLLLLIGMFIWNAQQDDEMITYAEVEIQQSGNSWHPEEEELSAILQELCDNAVRTCQTPEFISLQEELSFLEESKMAILAQMNPYENNTELEIMLTEVEIESSTIMQQMIDLLV